MQKSSGSVNTMAYLSPKENALYEELVAKGNGEAAQGLLLVGMSRIGTEGQMWLTRGQFIGVLRTS